MNYGKNEILLLEWNELEKNETHLSFTIISTFYNKIILLVRSYCVPSSLQAIHARFGFCKLILINWKHEIALHQNFSHHLER